LTAPGDGHHLTCGGGLTTSGLTDKHGRRGGRRLPLGRPRRGLVQRQGGQQPAPQARLGGPEVRGGGQRIGVIGAQPQVLDGRLDPAEGANLAGAMGIHRRDRAVLVARRGCEADRRPGRLGEFHSKLDDIGAHKGIMFTTVGYEAGAKKVAKGRGIALFILREGQQPGERRVETKAEKWPTTPNFLRGSFLPWGHFSASHDEVGYRVESADELFYLLAFSEVERFNELARQQRPG
jgi:hypothetical protein